MNPLIVIPGIFIITALICSIFDIIKMRFPLAVVFAGAAVLVWYDLYIFGYKFSPYLKNCLIGAGISLVIYLIVFFVIDGGLGFGDVIFGTFAGLFASYPSAITGIVFSALTGLIFYLISGYFHKKREGRPLVLKHMFAIPFVPFISAGTLLAWLLTFLFH